MQKLLAVVGPTATGKSGVSLILAKHLGGEIVSADSMQVYVGMDIGTAKPSPVEQLEVTHHLIDLIPPSRDFSVAEYQKLARTAIEQIAQSQNLPLLVGGSGLYVRAVIDRLRFPAGALGSSVRVHLETEVGRRGPASLYRELERRDPRAAVKIHPNNTRRVVRALEVIEATGKRFSDFQTEWEKRESNYDLVMIGLMMSRELLFRSVEERIDRQLEAGLIDEVAMLISQGYGDAITARQALGYKELKDHIEGRCSFEEAIELFKKRTRHFARRQMTWFKSDPRITWFEAAEPPVVVQSILRFLEEQKFT